MRGMLSEGAQLMTVQGEGVKVLEFIGFGGQGEVYRVRSGDRQFALKWYYQKNTGSGQRAIVKALVDQPIEDARILWPLRFIETPDGGFGYLMALRPQRFCDLPTLFRRELTVTMRTLLTVCINLSETYQVIHAQGFAYRDISWGNAFFDPANGDVLLTDNDNAAPEHVEAQVLGTRDFMAPELVRGQIARPSISTDLHSLAVLLFMLLMNHHPLQGARELAVSCLSDEDIRDLYGENPLFVFDPDDDSNRPVAGEQDTVIATWAAMTPTLRAMFTRSFTVGLHDPAQRPREQEWIEIFSRLRDGIVWCPNCNRQNLADPSDSGYPSPGLCWMCGSPLSVPPHLEVLTEDGVLAHRVTLYPGSELYTYHFENQPTRHDFTACVARVTEHPDRPGVYGITNLSDDHWTLLRRSGEAGTAVLPGKTIRLQPNIEIAAPCRRLRMIFPPE